MQTEPETELKEKAPETVFEKKAMLVMTNLAYLALMEKRPTKRGRIWQLILSPLTFPVGFAGMLVVIVIFSPILICMAIAGFGLLAFGFVRDYVCNDPTYK